MEQVKTFKPKSLFFIGNGFDIAHGHKTGYNNFCEFLKLKENCFTDNYLIKNILADTQREFWEDLEYGLMRYSKMLTKKHGKNHKESTDRFKKDFLELKRVLFCYLNDAQNSSVIDGYNPGSKAESLYNEWAKTDYRIVSFNYTFNVANYTVPPEKYNGGLEYEFDRLIYLHGSIKKINKPGYNCTDSIVLGIDETQKVEEAHSFLYKSHQNPYSYRDLTRLINESNIYVIYGCSMGHSDNFYFKTLFKNKKDKLFIVYGYGKKEVGKLECRVRTLVDSICKFKKENEFYIIDAKNQSSAFINTKEALAKWAEKQNR